MDLLQLHWPDRATYLWGKNQFDPEAAASYEPIAFEEQVTAVGDLIKAGKILHWGLSNETAYGVCKMVEIAEKLGVPPPVSIQNNFSLFDRRFESDLAEACYYNKVGLLPYSPLAGGYLTDKYHDGSDVDPNCRHLKFPTFQARYHCDRATEAALKYRALAQSKGLSLAQLALAWCKSRFYVTSTIIGANSLDQLKENIAAFDLDLDEETLKAVDAIHMERRNPNLTD